MKHALSNAPLEDVERAAFESGDTKLLGRVLDKRTVAVCKTFIEATPRYYGTHDNFDRMMEYLASKFHVDDFDDGNDVACELMRQGHFTIEELTAAYHRLDNQGLLEHEPGQLHAPSPDLLRQAELSAAQFAANVVMMAPEQATELQGRAICLYLASRGVEVASSPHVTEFAFMNWLNDPQNRAICDEAVMWFFYQITPTYRATQANYDRMAQLVGGRPLTVGLLQKCWGIIEEENRRGFASDLAFSRNEAPPVEIDPNSLTDAEVEDALRSFGAGNLVAKGQGLFDPSVE